MTAEDRAQSNLKRWLQTVLVVVAIGLLIMMMLQKGFIEDGWGWQQAEREVLLKRFNENLLLTKTEWLRRGRPSTVWLMTRDSKAEVVMNRNGWPSVENGCRELWQMLAGGRYNLVFSEQPQGCSYRLKEDSDEQMFTLFYNSETGQLK